jgi:hypothetical protein
VPGLASVTQVSLGTSHSCALLASGTVVCWGDELAYISGMAPGDPYLHRLTPTPISF